MKPIHLVFVFQIKPSDWTPCLRRLSRLSVCVCQHLCIDCILFVGYRIQGFSFIDTELFNRIAILEDYQKCMDLRNGLTLIRSKFCQRYHFPGIFLKMLQPSFSLREIFFGFSAFSTVHLDVQYHIPAAYVSLHASQSMYPLRLRIIKREIPIGLHYV